MIQLFPGKGVGCNGLCIKKYSMNIDNTTLNMNAHPNGYAHRLVVARG